MTALTQSARNATDGLGELQVADGSLAQVTTLLNRAVTIATEAANGTVSTQQQAALDAEFTAIKSEIDRIGTNTTYHGIVREVHYNAEVRGEEGNTVLVRATVDPKQVQPLRDLMQKDFGLAADATAEG